jgi:hypothetical protein
MTLPWWKKLRRYRYQAVIIGLESGNETVLPFVRFRSVEQADEWVTRMNKAAEVHPPLTAFDWQPIP